MKIERYTADWCGPCKMLAPVIKELEETTGVEVEVIDIDTFPEKAQDANVRSVPTLIFRAEDGSELDRIIGLRPKRDIEAKIAEYDK